jgi:hypothetical protein
VYFDCSVVARTLVVAYEINLDLLHLSGFLAARHNMMSYFLVI